LDEETVILKTIYGRIIKGSRTDYKAWIARGGEARKELPEIGRREFGPAAAMLRELQEVALALSSHVGFFRRRATAGHVAGIHNRCIV
jgi:hypothetical protein